MNSWRLLKDLAPLSGAENMAIDEALMQVMRASISATSGDYIAPILRFYSWKEATLSMGYRQDYQKYADINTRLPKVRRITGGGAVLHNKAPLELTYSLIAPVNTDEFCFEGLKGSIRYSYGKISHAFINALNLVGLKGEFVSCSGEKSNDLTNRAKGSPKKSLNDTCFSSSCFEEVTVKGRKLIGSAQKRDKLVFLQQGSIVFGKDKRAYENVFGEGTSDLFTSLAEEGVTVTPEGFIVKVVNAFSEEFNIGFSESCLSTKEKDLVDKFFNGKYQLAGWTEYREQPKFDKSTAVIKSA